jgi:hypothetical protein
MALVAAWGLAHHFGTGSTLLIGAFGWPPASRSSAAPR